MADKKKHLIGQRIGDYRLQNKWSREEMASKLSMKLANYGHLERGDQLPTIEQLKTLVSISNIPYAYWIDGVKYSTNAVENITTNTAMPISGKVTMHVPLVNQYAYAGYMQGYSDDTYIDKLPKLPWLVDREYKGVYMSFEVKGDSMDDGTKESYVEGDILLCRDIPSDLWVNSKLHIRKWDFVIAHKTEGIIIKKIIEHDVVNGTLKLHSLNQQYSDYTINVKDVIKIFNVVKVITSK